MSKEVIEIVIGMDRKKIENQLALQCAPLITGIKISNLLIAPSENDKLIRDILKQSGISSYRLIKTSCNSTYLLYRQVPLEKYLSGKEVISFLKEEGYTEFSLEKILPLFQKHYLSYMKDGENFPHEMGLLLGYPIEDVRGFVEHNGKNYLYAGYFKVYAKLEEKLLLFQKYEEAKETVIQLISAGFTMQEILLHYKENVETAV